jgi:hypothetical protein
MKRRPRIWSSIQGRLSPRKTESGTVSTMLYYLHSYVLAFIYGCAEYLISAMTILYINCCWQNHEICQRRIYVYMIYLYSQTSVHERLGSWTIRFTNKFCEHKASDDVLCLELRTRKPSTSWSDKLGVSAKWGEVQSFVEGYHPDKAVASRSINIFNYNAMIHFRNIKPEGSQNSPSGRTKWHVFMKFTQGQRGAVTLQKTEVKWFMSTLMVHVAVSKYNWQDSACGKFGSPISPLKCQKKNQTGPKYIHVLFDNGFTRQSLVKRL